MDQFDTDQKHQVNKENQWLQRKSLSVRHPLVSADLFASLTTTPRSPISPLQHSSHQPNWHCWSPSLAPARQLLFSASTQQQHEALILFVNFQILKQNFAILPKSAQIIVRVLELAGGVMDEMANPSGPRKELVNSHCTEFMQSVKDIQMTLREEIKSACEYRPFEKCDYVPRTSNEICCKKLEYVIAQLDQMKQTFDEYGAASY